MELTGEESALLIAGPTASGKSALALRLADEIVRRGREAVIVNADSMQVYNALPVLTARPAASETGAIAHRLYGHVPPSSRHSVGAWLGEAAAEIAAVQARAGVPIVVGGTGLYFRALTEGLASPPQVPPEVRRHWWARAESLGPGDLHRELARRDPRGAEALRPSDRQRILRALEVVDATGLPLREWQARTQAPPALGAEGTRRLVIEPDRAQLRERIGVRLGAMIAAGALSEVAELLALGLDPSLPVMKAIGVRPLALHLGGELTLEAATERAVIETRQYAKRQTTWLRNQMSEWERVGQP